MLNYRIIALLLIGFVGISVKTFAQIVIDTNVGEQTIIYYDSIRKRPLKTEIWYPTPEAITPDNNASASLPFVLKPTVRNASLQNIKHPLILLSHGTGGNRFSLAWLAYDLVKRGYMIVAVDHWGNTFDNKIPEQFVKGWERPQDLSFVLTQLLNDTLLRKNIDENKIGAAGFSLGGYTVIALAGGEIEFTLLKKYSQTKQGKKEMTIPEFGDLSKLIADPLIEESYKHCPPLKDNRIKAVFAVAPAMGQGFESEKQMENITNPVYIVGIENDHIAPVTSNATHYHDLIQGSTYYVIKGDAGHYVVLNVAKDELKKEAKLYYTDPLTVDRTAIHEDISIKALAFFQKALQKNEK
jgi:predicted dienelactone hydrolase